MKFIYILTIVFLLSTINAEAFCKRCQDLREYHRTHPENNYEFYEDYLKDQVQQQDSSTQPEVESE